MTPTDLLVEIPIDPSGVQVPAAPAVPPPWKKIVAIPVEEFAYTVLIPGPFRSRKVNPNPTVWNPALPSPVVPIPTPIPPPWNSEAVTIPEKDALPFVAMVAAVPALI